jgi:hypothetical protein
MSWPAGCGGSEHEQRGQWYATASRKYEPTKVDETMFVKNIGSTHSTFSLSQVALVSLFLSHIFSLFYF